MNALMELYKISLPIGMGWEDSAQDMDDSPGGNYAIGSAALVLRMDGLFLTKIIRAGGRGSLKVTREERVL